MASQAPRVACLEHDGLPQGPWSPYSELEAQSSWPRRLQVFRPAVEHQPLRRADKPETAITAKMLSAFTARPIVELKQQAKFKIESVLAYGKLCESEFRLIVG